MTYELHRIRAMTPDELDRSNYGASVKNGALLVELAAREAGRRKHKNWKRISAIELIAVRACACKMPYCGHLRSRYTLGRDPHRRGWRTY